MMVYPHWLDGEFVRISSNAEGPEQDVRQFIRAVKLHAILGTTFVIGDVQLFDSAAVLELFWDNNIYRNFFHNNPGFIKLKVDPDPNLGSSNSFALAARGLMRAITPEWRSSVFVKCPDPVKKLADEILKEVTREVPWVEPDRPSETLKHYPQFAKPFKAIRRAIHYFGDCYHNAPDQLLAPVGERSTYYEVLCSSREKLPKLPHKLVRRDAQAVEQTIDYIDMHLDESERGRRSNVLAILDHDADNRKKEVIWNNVVQAWNCAMGQTLGPEGGSGGNLPHAACLDPYLRPAIDTLVPLGKSTGPFHSIKDSPTLLCNIDKLSWTEIDKIRGVTKDTQDKLTRARRELARAHHSGDQGKLNSALGELMHSLRDHLRNVAMLIITPTTTSNKASMYALRIAGPSGGIAVALFGPVSNLVKAGAAGIGLASISIDIWDDVKTWRKRRALVNTLLMLQSK